MLNKYKIIFWDFDGVILDSNNIRTNAFIEIFKNFPKDQISDLVKYHIENGGLSRYEKIEYFFINILKKKITKEELLFYAKKYKLFILEHLVHKKYIINQTINFIKKKESIFSMFIVSASDENELRYICRELELEHFFDAIHGSPRTKKNNIGDLIKLNNLKTNEIVLIGDSLNDYEAAVFNKIDFIGFNNPKLENFAPYIKNFSNLD